MEAALRHWVEETTGATVTSAERGFAGGSRELWFVETGSRSVVVRVETGAGAFHGTPLTLEREATVCRALWGTDVPVAEVLGITDDSTAVLMARLAGTSDLRRLDAADGPSLVDSFMRALGALHRIDVHTLDLPGIARPEQPLDHALNDLALWDGLVRDHLVEPDPLLGLASTWLREHAPCSVARTVLVQGDTGPGNFLFEGAEVTGLVDWEMSHVGDPMDDIAWLDFRCGGSGPWADVAERDRLYERASGIRIDERVVAYYRVLVYLRCAVTTAMAIVRGGGALGVAAYSAPHYRFLVQLAGALGEATGAQLVGIDRPIAIATAASPLYDRAIDGLRTDVLPSLRDRPARLAARGALLVLEHERVAHQLRDPLAEMERRDRVATFGTRCTDAEIQVACTEAGRTAAPDVVSYLLRRAQRGLVPWATPAVGEDVAPVPSPRSGV